MTAVVEILDKLQRRMTVDVMLSNIQIEIEKQLKAQAKTMKMPGFRPGKVPIKFVVAQHGVKIRRQALDDELNRVLGLAIRQNNLRVAGFQKIEPIKEDGVFKTNEIDDVLNSVAISPDTLLRFNAIFEVYPDISIGNFSTLELEQVVSQVAEADIDRTLHTLQQQGAHYHLKNECHDGSIDIKVENGDQVTIDFTGKIDGQDFLGSKGQDICFVLGKNKMLPAFEAALIGMKLEESKTFPLTFPDDYREEVKGKTAEFTVTLKQVASEHLPDIDGAFIKSIGIADGGIGQLRTTIKMHLEREMRIRLMKKNKNSVMNALLNMTTFDLPNTLVEEEMQRELAQVQKHLKTKGQEGTALSQWHDSIKEQAKRKVRIHLIVSEVLRKYSLTADKDYMKTYLEDMAQMYEDPQLFIKKFFSDKANVAHLETIGLEEALMNFVFSQAKVIEKKILFFELMTA